MNQDYTDYINSKEWKAKRQMVLERDNYECQQCGTKDNLHVHHITYEHFKNEPLEDLVTLCKECHCETHKGSSIDH